MLRIIGGTARGRLLKVPRGTRIRPTSDKVRESLFNIIGPEVVRGARFLDLFAGCGAVGIEALSRGARFVTFVESNPRHARAIRENIEICGFQQSVEILCAESLSVLTKLGLHKPSYDIIFADPPYDYPKWKILLSKIVLNVNMFNYGFFIVEHSTKVSMPEKVHDIARYGVYTYGDTTLTVYRKTRKSEENN